MTEEQPIVTWKTVISFLKDKGACWIVDKDSRFINKVWIENGLYKELRHYNLRISNEVFATYTPVIDSNVNILIEEYITYPAQRWGFPIPISETSWTEMLLEYGEEL